MTTDSPSDTGTDRRFSRLLRRLRERKLVQWAIAYAAGAWLILQIIDTVGFRWGVTDFMARVLDVVLIVGFVATLVVAWYHGEQGRQRVNGVELLMLGALLLLGGIGVKLVQNENPEAGVAVVAEPPAPIRSSDAAPHNLKTIAVLPFDNYSPNPDDEYFAAGITEEITGQLARIGDLTVLSRVAVERAVENENSLEAIAQTLGAGSVLEGSVRMAGDRVRITAQLIDMSDQNHLWSNNFDRELNDIFQIQTDVALAIGDALLAELTSGERDRIATPSTQSIRAYQLYLKQQGRLPGNVPEANREAIDLLKQALEIDPQFAEARARLAWRYVWEARLTGELSHAEKARQLAEEAIEQDPQLPSGYYALGSAQGMLGRIEENVKSFERAIELDPNHSSTLSDLSWVYATYRQPARGLEIAYRDLRLDPNSPNTRWHAYIPLLALGDTARIADWLQLTRDEDMVFHRLVAAEVELELLRGDQEQARTLALNLLTQFDDQPEARRLALAYLFIAGAWDEFQEEFIADGRNSPDVWTLTQLLPRTKRTLMGYVLAELGQTPEAEAAFEESLEQHGAAMAAGSTWYGRWVDTASIHAYRGDHDAAFEALERAFELGLFADFALKMDPMFASLRDYPRFTSLLERIAAYKEDQRELARRTGAYEGYDQLIAAGPARN